MLLMDHGSGIISHVMCGFNYFDPYGHLGKGQEKPTILIYGNEGNMRQEDVMRSIELFGTKVIPALKED